MKDRLAIVTGAGSGIGYATAVTLASRGARIAVHVNQFGVHSYHSPVGYTAYPLAVGAKGNVFHANLELNF